MKIEITNQLILTEIPSASGIAKIGNNYYVIGDDSPYLFCLDETFKLISKTLIHDSKNRTEDIILKENKPDFEALEAINEHELVIFGSGSKSPERNIFIHVFIQNSITFKTYDISDFYDHLKKLPVLKNSELNIEAVAYKNKILYLFNRKKNLIFQFEFNELIAYFDESISFPTPIIKPFKLLEINGIEAGFSGATIFNNKPYILFTASIENTNNAYDDGEIIGSLIGCISLKNNTISDEYNYQIIPNKKNLLKVESVTIANEFLENKTNIILVTDSDGGDSLLLECDFFSNCK